MGDLYRAGGTHFNVGLALEQAGRLTNAQEYAYAALRNYETYDQGATDKVQKTRGLIEEIERQMKG